MSERGAIGTVGIPWADKEKKEWLEQQQIQRSYEEEVLCKIRALEAHYTIEQYGMLSFNQPAYPLFSLRTKSWDPSKKSFLVTGGVHGYETSGVQGALRYAEEYVKANKSATYNVVIVPCVCPWGYETINRWNPDAIDPNRSFQDGTGLIQEASLLYAHIADINISFDAHFDLHETTDTDKTVFRPALHARDGNVEAPSEEIPDGFYLVADPAKPASDFNKAIISRVKDITHIVPPSMTDFSGVDIEQHGVIVIPGNACKLGLCMGLTAARFVVTTEVYPDSPSVTPENCILAQVVAVTAGVEFVLAEI